MSHHWLQKDDQKARDRKIVGLHKSGYSYRLIAARMGITTSIVYEALKREGEVR